MSVNLWWEKQVSKFINCFDNLSPVNPRPGFGYQISSCYRFTKKSEVLCHKHVSRAEITRTTRTPAFWAYPLPPHDYPYYLPFHIGSQVKTRRSQNCKFKKIAKTSLIFFNFDKNFTPTHLLKLLDNMCKYEMDLVSIVENTELTRFCPKADSWPAGWMDSRTDKVKPVYPPSTSLSRGYN